MTAATRPAEDGLARRDFDYTPQDFARVRRLIHGRVGIALNETVDTSDLRDIVNVFAAALGTPAPAPDFGSAIAQTPESRF